MAFDAFDRLARFRDPTELQSGIHCSQLLKIANQELQSLDSPEDRIQWNAARKALRTRTALWNAIIVSRGSRYAQADLKTFELLSPGHKQAAETVADYMQKLETGKAGNLVFIGPPGTGKDHLMIAVVRYAVLGLGLASAWTDGQAYFGAVRDAYSTDETETPLVNFAIRSELFAISDPIPSNSSVTEHQRNLLFRLIDGRYSWLRPILTTINVATYDELCDRLGDSLADRLCNKCEHPPATIVPCNWPSYRRETPLRAHAS